MADNYNVGISRSVAALLVAGVAAILVTTLTATTTNTQKLMLQPRALDGGTYGNVTIQSDLAGNSVLYEGTTSNGNIACSAKANVFTAGQTINGTLALSDSTVSLSTLASTQEKGTKVGLVVKKSSTAVGATTVSSDEVVIGPSYDDIRCLGFVRTTGANDMAVSEYISGSGVYDRLAASGKSIYFTVQLPHGWRHGSKLDPHVHWSCNADTSAYDGTTVIWTLTYTLASPAGSFPGVNSDRTATYTYPVTTDNNQWKHMYTDLGDIDMSAFTAATDTSVILIGRLTRTGDASNTTIFLHEFDIHFQRDGLGSDAETTKNY